MATFLKNSVCYNGLMKKTIKNALADAGLTVLYIALVAGFMIRGENALKNETASLMMMLLLLVVSVAMMGVLIFGKPALWYLEGKKKEAWSLLLYTVGFLSAALILLYAVLNAGPF